MAFLTYCCQSIAIITMQRRRHSYHVEQICLLIITFVVYVSGITNNAPQTLQNAAASGDEFRSEYYQQERPTYQSAMPTNYDFQRPITPPPPPPPSTLLESKAKESIQKEFRPSEQVYDFTLSDATPVTSNYPPSYLNSNYMGITMAAFNNFPSQLQQQPEEMANRRYKNNNNNIHNNNKDNGATNSQFAFPTEAASNAFTQRVSTVPPQLQTTPILSYKDPYTNENYQAVTRSTIEQRFQENDNDDANLIYYGNHQYQGDVAAQQAYTVQSSLLVGSQSNPSRDDNYRPLSSPNNEYKRPGYVFDEQIRPNHISNSNKFKQPSSIYSNRKPIPPQRLSYDSHDYPPPSYYQKPAQKQQQPQQQQHHHTKQQSAYFQSPQRQDIGFKPISQATTQTESYLNVVPSPTSSSSNYANNFGNYLLADAQQQYQHQQQHYRPPPVKYQQHVTQGNYYPNQQRPPISAHGPPSNYYEYQLGEIPTLPQRRPPPPHNYPNFVVPRPPLQVAQQPTGLASLASLFTSTQQYAPQFTNLLLGAFTGGGGEVGSTSSLLRPQQRPLNMQLIRALENIARNDDLQCVPKVLCQTIAGQTQRGQLPNFVTSPAITNFLAGFPAASPALIYGRAALLGISGGERSCAQTYGKCPKNEYEILYYLNNHRGGFFKFFSEPEEQTSAASANGNGNYDGNDLGSSSTVGGGGGGGGVSSSLFSILTALTGNPAPRPTTTTTTTTQRPTTTLDIAGGIGNFFTQVLSDYLSGVEYQRRRRRRSVKTEIEVDTIEPDANAGVMKILNNKDFHDEEDNEDTELKPAQEQQYENVEARILHKDEIHADYPKFFPSDDDADEKLHATSLEDSIKTFNKQISVRKLKFPSSYVNNRDPGKLGISWINFEDSTNAANDQTFDASSKRRGKKINFKQADVTEFAENSLNEPTKLNTHGQRIIFPDHYEQHIRKARIVNRPKYADSFSDYVRTTVDEQDRFVISNMHRRPHYQNFEQSNSLDAAHYYTKTNAHYTSSITSSDSNTSSSSSTNSYGNHYDSQESGFRPTPLPVSNKSSSLSYDGYKGYRGSSSSNINSHSGSYLAFSRLQSDQNSYNYPNNSYDSNNRYSSNYQRFATTTTRRPRHEDDPNIYVNNGNGVTEYYITPDGRKIYL